MIALKLSAVLDRPGNYFNSQVRPAQCPVKDGSQVIVVIVMCSVPTSASTFSVHGENVGV